MTYKISQRMLEHLLHKQHVKEAVKQEIITDLSTSLDYGVYLFKEWLDDVKWPTHEARKDPIRYSDVPTMVADIMAVVTLACQEPLPLVSVIGMINLTSELESLDSMQLAGDILALLAPVGLYELTKTLSGTYVVQSLIEPSDRLQRQIKIGCYLPPMVEKPAYLETNSDSGYLTIQKDRVILKHSRNFHSGPVSLDVLNIQNANEYELDEHITSQTKPWRRPLLSNLEIYCLRYEDQEKYKNELKTYEAYLEQFLYLKELLRDRTIYFTNKVDKRGRIYTQGYHFSSQGSAYEKASINLRNKQLITGEL